MKEILLLESNKMVWVDLLMVEREVHTCAVEGKGCLEWKEEYVWMCEEYMAAVEADKKLIWMRNFLSELGMKQREFLLHDDNQSAIIHTSSQEHCVPLSDQAYTEKVSWLCERVDENQFALVKIHTDERGLHMLMKVVYCT